MKPINESSLDWTESTHGKTTFRRKRLAAAAGGVDLGASLYELPPGAHSWPAHFHTGNEEALFVLSGVGQLQLGEERLPLETGDYVAFPVAEGVSHRVVNDGAEPLRYLALSTMREPDITVYPESGKIGVFAGSAPGSDEERTVHGYYREADEVEYWLDEE